MRLRAIAISAVLAAASVALPYSTAAQAQYYGPPCTPFPLTWPFCIVGAAVGTAATIVSAPFRAASGYPYYYGSYRYPYYAPPPPAYPYYPPR